MGDIDGVRERVHIRDAKGNRDRFVLLAQASLQVLRRFWLIHRNPVLLFPDRHRGLQAAASTTTALNAEGVQRALARVIGHCGLKKRLPPTAYATAMPLT